MGEAREDDTRLLARHGLGGNLIQSPTAEWSKHRGASFPGLPRAEAETSRFRRGIRMP